MTFQNNKFSPVPTPPPTTIQRQAIYILALILTIATFFLRQALSVSFGERPLLIMFMFPILVSALLGGIGPGLTATLVAAICTALLIPPADSLVMAANRDVLQWGMLITNGVLVSILSESLHRSRQRETAKWHQLAVTQNQLLQSETRFQATFEQAAVGIAMVAPDGQWLRVNHKLCEIVGYSQEELLARTFQNITHPDDLQADLDQLQRMLTGEIQTYSIEKHYIRKDGSLIWINHTTALVWKTNTIPDYFISVIEDIQARKAAEYSLLLERDCNKHYLDAVQVIMVALDSEGMITMINRAGLELLGYASDELLDRDWFTTCLPQPEGKDIIYPFFRRIMAGEIKSAEYFENPILCRDGQTRLIAWRNAYLTDNIGRIVGTLSSGQDITERKAAEAELIQRNDELERFNRTMIGRELDMIALKQQVNELSRQLGQKPPYPLAFLDVPPIQPKESKAP